MLTLRQINQVFDIGIDNSLKKSRSIFGNTDDKQTQALSVNQVCKNAPVTLILHGEQDKVVTPRSAHSLAETLAAHRLPHLIETYPSVGLRRIIAAMSSLLSFLTPTTKDIIDILAENECRPAAS